ncbi:tapemeasure protein [Mycobacterium phage Damien]|uniref:tail length tape measure protein n=1 Tax=Mycobacterium phage Damien TaxID=1486469 RepID=UPI00045F727D|nr:tail length tape measure protein [Mycobacterium phage Damien]AHZ95387.1 tapemeasure protein [Mycobacterium phage Damien]
MTSPGSPNYDLGTAHGRIKLDVDDRGTKAADRALTQFTRSIKSLERQFVAFNASLNKIEREVKNLGRDFNRTERDAKSFERATDDVDAAQVNASRSTSGWRAQLRSLASTMGTAHDLIRRAAKSTTDFGHAMNLSGGEVHKGRREVDVLNVRLRDLIRRLHQASNAANDFGGVIANAFALWSRWGNNNDGFNGFVRSFRNLPVAAGAVGLLSSRFLGLNKAMKDVPRWQKSILSLVGAFQGAALASKLFDLSLNKLFKRDLNFLRRGASWVSEFAFHVTRAIAPSNKLGEQIRRLNSGFRGLGGGAAGAIAGLALFRQGLKGLSDRFGFITKIRPAILLAIGGAASVAAASVELLGKALVWTSNILSGMWNGIKQLSGGLLALPGLIGTVVTGVGVLATAFSGLKSMFEDVFKNLDDPEKFAEALAKVPPQFRGLALTLVDVTKMLKGLREEITGTFAQGLEKDVKTLAQQFAGPLRHGTLVVSQAFVDTRSKLMDLLTSQDSVQDFGRAFTYTSGTIRNLNKAIVPLGSGLRDIAIVGMEFIRDLSAGAESVTKRFAEWAKVNRENGNLMRWMKDAVEGVKDLTRGLVDLTKALWTILTAFADRSGDNALDRFAKSMEKFNAAVEKSAATGWLREFADGVRALGTDKIERLTDILKDVWETLKVIIPVVQQVSSAFSDVFVPAFKLALEIVEQFFNFLDGLGLTTYIGWILGLAAGFKLLAAVIGPLRNLIQIISGVGLAFASFKKLAGGAADILYYFGAAGRKTHGVMSKLGSAIAGVAGPLGILVGSLAFMASAFAARRQDIAKFNDTLAEAKQQAQDFKGALNEAFREDLGITGKTVLDTIAGRTGEAIANIKSQAEQVPGVIENIRDLWFGGGGQNEAFGAGRGPFSWAQSNEFNAMQKAAQDAEHAKVAFDRLGLSNEDLAGIVAGSKQRFDEFNQSLRNSGEGGNEAAAVLQQIREEYAQTQAEFEKAGTGSIQLVQGIQAIADAAGDSRTKLDGLKLALQGLGLLQTSQLDAAFAYAKTIREIGNSAATLVDSTQPLNDILNEQTGLYNTNSVNAENLRNAIASLASDFLNAAANGESVQQKWQEMQPALESLATAFQIPIEKVRELAALEGAVPDVVSILVNVKGGDKIGEQLAAIVAKLETTAQGQEITVPIVPGVDQEKLRQAITEKFGNVIGSMSEDTITIKPGVDPAALAELKATLSQNGIALPGSGPAKPVELPVAPAKPGPKPAYEPPPEIAPSAEDQAKVDEAKNKIAELEAQVTQLNEQKVQVQVDTGTLDEIKSRIEEVRNVVADGKLEFTIIAKGYDETNYVLNTVIETIGRLISEAEKIAPAFQRAFSTTPIDGFSSRMQQLVSEMRGYGQKLVSELAQGMLDSKGAIDEAGNTIAQAVQDYLQPGSPTKKGPLSGSGWTYTSGGRLIKDFASGMEGEAGTAGGAAGAVASATGQALQGPYDFGKFLGRLQQLVAFGEHLVDVIGRAADTVFNAIKFISDPQGKGTFFGKSSASAFGFRRDPNVTDDDLRRKREDELQNRLSSAAAQGTREGAEAGLSDLPGLEALEGVANPNVDEITAAVIGEGLRQGATREAIIKSLPAEVAKFGKEFEGNAGETFDEIVSSLTSPRSRGGYGSGGYVSDAALLANVPVGRYSQQGNADLTKGLADCSSAVEDLVNIMDGRGTGGRSLNTGNAAQWLLERGFVRGEGGPGDFRVAFNVSHMQATLPGGTPFNWGSDAAARRRGIGGTGADDPSLTSRWYRPVTSAHGSQGNGLGPDLSELTPDELDLLNRTQGLSLKTEEDMLFELRRNNAALDEAITVGQDPNSTDAQVIQSLAEIQRSIDSSAAIDTPAMRQQTQSLESIKSAIMGDRGITEGVNPIDAASSIAQGATSIAKDIFGVINSTLDAIGGAKAIADTLVRGVENTEDIYNMVDEFQKFIDLAARVAGAVSSVTGTIGGIVSAAGGADPSGGASGAASALQGISAISGIISGALDTVNGIIDLAQEAYRIWGTYFGEFLGFLAGAGSQLEGNVKFLLDENDKTLKAYSQDNPLDKREHTLPFQQRTEQQPAIGELNVFPERGADPAELTRTMMFAVKTASMGASNQQ